MKAEFAKPRTTTAALLLFALIVLTSPPPTRAQSPSSICQYAPEGMEVSGPFQTSGSEQEHCFFVSPVSKLAGIGIIIRRFVDSASANDEGLQFLVGTSGWEESSGYGERTIACTKDDCRGFGTGGVIFHRGCYTVQGGWNADTEQQIRAGLSEIDSKLQSAPCPGSAAAPPPPVNPGAPELALACDPANLQADGRVTCNAGVSDAPEGSAFAYSWTLDGSAQGATGVDLELTDLAVGSHSVSVTARDSNTNTELGPKTASFTRLPANESGGESESPLGEIPIPVWIGGAAAATLALAGLGTLRRRRAATPGRSTARPVPTGGPESVPLRAAPTDGPEPRVRARAAPPTDSPEPQVIRRRTPPPVVGPEPSVQPRKDRQRPPPVVTVQLILRPSILTQLLYNVDSPQLIGDKVDFMITGYQLTVGPPGEWEVDSGPGMSRYGREEPGLTAAVIPTWSVSKGRCQLLDAFHIADDELKVTLTADQFRAPLNQTEPLTDDRNAAIVAPWCDNDDSVAISVDVSVRVRSTDRAETWPTPIRASASTAPDQPVLIIGAKPIVSLAASTQRRDQIGLAPVEGGDIGAEADGKCRVHVVPNLYLFEQLYAGGTKVVLSPMGGDGGLNVQNSSAPNPVVVPASGDLKPLFLGDFFEVALDRPAPITVAGKPYVDQNTLLRMQQGLSMRCKFRFDDAALKRLDSRGCPVQFEVSPTGLAFGTDQWNGPYDWMLGFHYASCGLHYSRVHLPQPDPVHISLAPSKIKIEDPEPTKLPKIAAGDDRFVSHLKGSVLSATDEPVDGPNVLQKDVPLATIKNWHFRFWYQPPSEAWRRELDPGIDSETAESLFERNSALAVTGVQSDGQLLFGERTYLLYNHKELFEKVITHEGRTYDPSHPDTYIGGQTCDVQVEFCATDTPLEEEKVDRVSFASQKPIHIAAIDDEAYQVKIIVLAQSGEPLAGAKVRIGAQYSTKWDSEVIADNKIDRIVSATTDENGMAIAYYVPARVNPYKIYVEWHTHPQTEDYSGQCLKDRPPDIPAPPFAEGHLIKRYYKDVIIKGSETHTKKFPVSSSWAIQTATSSYLGIPIVDKFLPAAETVLGAYLINRGTMPTGDIPAGRPRMGAPSPDELEKVRRIFLRSTYVDESWSVLPGGIDVSDPGSTPFRTTSPVSWHDFNNVEGGFSQVGGNLYRGKSFTTVCFVGVTTRPIDLNVTSWVVSTTPTIGAQGGPGTWRIAPVDWRPDD